MVVQSTRKNLTQADMPLTGAGEAAEIYVDGYQGAYAQNGVVKVHFHTIKFDPVTQAINREVVFTMVTPVVTLAQIAASLTELVESFKRDGVLTAAPAPAPAPEKTNA